MTQLLRRVLLSDYFVLGLSLLYVAAVAPFTPGFVSAENFTNILSALLPLLVVALGQTIVLITGGIDLSVTAVIGLSSIVGAMAMNHETGWLAQSPIAAPAGVMIMLLVGASVGALNGIAVAIARMPAFMVTLASMMGFSGLAVWLTHAKTINALPSGFTMLGGHTMITLAIVLVVGICVHVFLRRSLWGRWLYAVGHNSRASHISGVPVGGITFFAYVASGLLAAMASVLYTGQTETGSPVLGQNILLDVIGATVIGGTSLFGGKGKVVWTLFGVLFLKLVDNSLNLLNLSIFAITIAKGAVILLAAYLDSLRNRFVAA
ncbi:hypothetical protein GC207_02390 [bacterium]|nr:hypothetical protein [bacterium]